MGNNKLWELRHLWDGTADWTLMACYYSEVELTLVFSGEDPTIQEIIALRKLIKEYREKPARQVKNQLQNLSPISLSRFSSFESREILEQAHDLRLNITSLDISRTPYIPFNRKDQSALLIEDEDLLKLVVEKMLATGIRVTEIVEVD